MKARDISMAHRHNLRESIIERKGLEIIRFRNPKLQCLGPKSQPLII